MKIDLLLRIDTVCIIYATFWLLNHINVELNGRISDNFEPMTFIDPIETRTHHFRSESRCGNQCGERLLILLLHS